MSPGTRQGQVRYAHGLRPPLSGTRPTDGLAAEARPRLPGTSRGSCNDRFNCCDRHFNRDVPGLGYVNPNWPHGDGGMWPRLRWRGSVAGGFGRSSPEDAGGVAVDLGQEVFDSAGGGRQVVDVKAEVAVVPGSTSRTCRRRFSAAGRSGSWSILVRSPLAMAGAAFDDRQVPRGELALDADLVAGVLGYPSGAPSLYSCDVQFWQGHPVHPAVSGPEPRC